jgi:hypothetical protein
MSATERMCAMGGGFGDAMDVLQEKMQISFRIFIHTKTLLHPLIFRLK